MILELLTLDPLILAIGASAIAGIFVLPIYLKNKNKNKKSKKTNPSKSSVTDGAELVQPDDHEPQTYTINTVHDSTHYEHLDLNTQEINKPMRTILEETLRKKTTIEKIDLALKYEQAKKHNVVELILEHALKYELDDKEKTRLKVILRKFQKKEHPLKSLIKKYPSFLEQKLSSESKTFREVKITNEPKSTEVGESDNEEYKKYDFSDTLRQEQNTEISEESNQSDKPFHAPSHLESMEDAPQSFNTEAEHASPIEDELRTNQTVESSDYSYIPEEQKTFGDLLNEDPLLNDLDAPSSNRDIENQLLKLKEEAEQQDSLTEEETTKFFEAFQSLHEQNMTPTIEEENHIMSENQKSAVWANWMGTNNGKLSLKSSYFTLNSKWGTKSAIEELKTFINDQNQNDGATNPKNWVLLSIIEIKN